MSAHIHDLKPSGVSVPYQTLCQIDDGVGIVKGVRGDWSKVALTNFRRRLTMAKIPINADLDEALHKLIMRAIAQERRAK